MNRFFAPMVLTASLLTCAMSASANDLTGTSWRLVKIQSMNDTVDIPADSANFTLEFLTDGIAAMQADCNRGSGEWTSASPSELRFGTVASTQAMCPPGSLSDKYLAQFEWVRSYVIEDGSLFLATMADGAIIEFAPITDASETANVLGEVLTTTDADALQATILSRLFDQFAAERGIEATTVEIDALLANMHSDETDEAKREREELTVEEVAEIRALENEMAMSLIRQWKINKALYEQYGGRIIYQQLGPEPLDAYLKFLKQRESEGGFSIYDKALADGFWAYFTNEKLHDFMEPGSADEATAYSTPPWEKAE